MSLANKYGCNHVLEEENNKFETKLSASFLKQDPNTQTVKNNVEFNITTQNMLKYRGKVLLFFHSNSQVNGDQRKMKIVNYHVSVVGAGLIGACFALSHPNQRQF